LRAAESALAALEGRTRAARPGSAGGPISGVLFLRADLARGAVAGGSIAHLVGVINELQKRLPVDVVTSDPIPLLDEGVRVACAKPEPRPGGDPEARLLQFNSTMIAAAEAAMAGKPGRLLYQRYSVHNWTGVAVARRFGLPFVLEYNGPEVWVARHWARPLRHPELAERIERLNLAAADLVTVVSEPLRQRLLAQGVPDRRILVNPNGVDLERFAPALDGAAVRARHELEGRTVIGFIGTFGPWHGVETLAEAFASLLARRPDLRARTRLLLIGDGVRLPAVRDLLQRRDRLHAAVLTGLVPQAEGPSYLAACDIVALPTMPNLDGSPFFGSPTKLFEYMAMGRAIAAARLGQAADVLDDEVSALLHAPGDAAALAGALERLVDDGALRRRLGAAARERAQERHSWSAHVARLEARLARLD
jgi:glycosyltransferase involved in cell wall biosynthesis